MCDGDVWKAVKLNPAMENMYNLNMEQDLVWMLIYRLGSRCEAQKHHIYQDTVLNFMYVCSVLQLQHEQILHSIAELFTLTHFNITQ